MLSFSLFGVQTLAIIYSIQLIILKINWLKFLII